MKKFLHNKLGHGLSKRVIISIFVLAAVDMLSMTAPYYLKYVIPHIYTYMNIAEDQFDKLNAVLGWTVLAFQLPSGWLADKISSRRMLITSVIMSGITTILFGMACQGVFGASSVIVLYFIFVSFGISTTLFLWSPLWKVLSQQGKADEQGSVYGLEGSYNGLLGLVLVTLIGTFATMMAKNGDNTLFYALVYIIGGGLFISAFGTWKFIRETEEKSVVLMFIKRMFNRAKKKAEEKMPQAGSIKVVLMTVIKPMLSIRVWLLAFFVLGMYMFQSIFAYYLKGYIALILPAIAVTALAGARTYGLRLIISAPFGKWLNKRRSYVLSMVVILAIGLITAIILLLIPGWGNSISKEMSHAHKLALQIIMPILFIMIGSISWFLTAGRYAQISEIPIPGNSYATIVATISFVAFSSDAWFYQMASSWMKNTGHVMTKAQVLQLGYGSAGGYDQAGLQELIIVALSIVAFGLICGTTAFLINKHEIKKLGKTSYRWRELGNQ